MKKRLHTAWIEDLRSFPRQCTGILRQSEREGDAFCCLGRLAVVGGLTINGAGANTGTCGGKYREIDELLFPSDPSGRGGKLSTLLIDLNDKKKLSFPEIADWIESNVPTEEDGGAEAQS